ncbi:transporter [Neorhizobium sp. P12A]|jgi:zinc transporter|uniref:transporter n=1 Tax=Rhizobium/Agrobacterium group TaxID=227290 RepID=UPI0010447AD5|nr:MULTISPECIES: transporter [Rhizobium/Agrobacterium group]KAA0699711.1 transporter [Neorhizobium sp. P12A]TCR91344.1 zinc transporter [Rhizobium sp. BK376]
MHQISIATIPGFVWAYRFGVGSNAFERLADTTAREELCSDGSFIWLHLSLVDARVGAFLDEFPGLTEAARTALTTHETHGTITVDEQMVFGTLVDFQRDFDQDTRNLGWLHFAISDRFIITTRLQPLRSVERARATVEKNPIKFQRPLDIFELLVIEFQRTLISLVIEITEELNLIEDFVYENAERDERRRLAPVRRTMVRLHRHLRTILSLMRRAAASDDDEMPLGFDDVAGRLTGRLETVDQDVYALQERARLLHEEIDSKLSSETNRHLYILSIMTAFLLPPTLVTGFFGMNTSALPFANGTNGTEYAIGLIIISLLLAWWLLKKVKIL